MAHNTSAHIGWEEEMGGWDDMDIQRRIAEDTQELGSSQSGSEGSLGEFEGDGEGAGLAGDGDGARRSAGECDGDGDGDDDDDDAGDGEDEDPSV